MFLCLMEHAASKSSVFLKKASIIKVYATRRVNSGFCPFPSSSVLFPCFSVVCCRPCLGVEPRPLSSSTNSANLKGAEKEKTKKDKKAGVLLLAGGFQERIS